ncbi:zeta toxin family protein [Rossellomorea vietnamensis]|uniref:zeta toxin family protein n=1 Tax=Rossellomorea vietnamensis TaxID=218284 RepID=UPI00077C7189|nr:zeta toxin family protein [Rossellomorea vietnamensis]
MEFMTTKDIHERDGEYHNLRKLLHKVIMKKFLHIKMDNDRLDNPVAILLGGGSGAGKTSVLDDIIGEEGCVIIDADKIKQEIPEFQLLKSVKNNLAADVVHDESSHTVRLLLRATIGTYRDFVYDGTMIDSEKYVGIIKELKENGYSVHMVMVDADVEVAVKRVALRNSEGRFVSEEFVRKSNRLVSESFSVLNEYVDSFIIYDNSINGKHPSEIAHRDSKEAEFVIDNEELYNNFKRKGILM